MLLSLAEPAEPAEKDEIDLWPEFRDRRILSTLHALRAEVFNNLHLYLLIIFMFSIASSFSVMLEWFYRASMQFLSGNHDIFWIPAKNLWEWQCCWAFCHLTSVLCLINQNSEVRSQKSEFCLLDVIIKEGLYQVNKPDLENSCYGIFTAAGYGIYFTFEVVITYGLFHQKLSCVIVICCYNQRPFTTNHTFHNKYLQISTNYHE